MSYQRIPSPDHEEEVMPNSLASVIERQTSAITTCDTVISVEDPSSSPTTSSIRSSNGPAPMIITEEATIFDISSNSLSQNCSDNDEEHQVDGTYPKSTIR